MAPPVHYLRPGEQADIHAWLMQKLQEERREVLLQLEERHRDLLGQFLMQARTLAIRDTSREYSDGLDNNNKPNLTHAGLASTRRVPEHELTNDSIDPDDFDEHKPDASVVPNETGAEVKDGNASPSLNASTTAILEHSGTTDFSTTNEVHAFERTRRGQAFEWFCGSMILVNAVVMAFNQQYQGLQRGYKLGVPTYDDPQDVAWPGGDVTFEISEMFFTILFTGEFVIRWMLFRLAYLKEVWCYIDGAIVAFAWVIVIDSNLLEFNPTFVRLIRVTKLLRLVRLLKSNQMFDCLKLLVSAINASFNILLWSLCVLILIISVGSLFMVQMLEPYLNEVHIDDEEKVRQQRKVFQYFGTFWRALLTMFEITFANWVVSMRVLVENVAESYGVFYLLYRCVIGLAVLMVVQAVFIQQTMKATQLDDDALANQKRIGRAKLLRRLEKVFRRLDTTGDGTIEKAEFENAMQHPEMVSMLEVFELEVSDIDVLFKLLDDGDGSISVGEFVQGVEHMGGPARAIDMLECKRDLKKLKSNLIGKKTSRTPPRS